MISSDIRSAADAMIACADDLRAAGIVKFRLGDAEIILGPKPPEERPDLGDDEPERPEVPDAPVDWASDPTSFPGGRLPRRRKARSSRP